MTQLPLAERLRPTKLSDFVGQQHLTGVAGVISKLLVSGKTTGYFPSLILWGPPGCGKTTLARIISKELGKTLFEFSAVNTSIKEIEKVVDSAAPSQRQHTQPKLLSQTPSALSTESPSQKPLIFIDEIHRFNKAQQDALLPHVEKGTVTLIGATTENPSFEVIGPLLSRTRVVLLNQLTKEDIHELVTRAVKEVSAEIAEDAVSFLVSAAAGDARVALNTFELAVNLAGDQQITLADIEQALQRRHLTFDLQGEEFYNTISALHKSIRGSDPDAALYWLARMLEAGQDPLYIARRVIRSASEDIGLKDPQALILAVSAFQACDRLGMPECNLALAEAVVYLAKAPKSNALYMAYGKASEDVHTHGNLPVPLHIRNAVTKLMKAVGYGKNYSYHHSAEGKKQAGITYLPDKLKGRRYF